MKQDELELRKCCLSEFCVKLSYFSIHRACLNFFEFVGQLTKNVHYVRKVCLRNYLCVSRCLSEFYDFFLET